MRIATWNLERARPGNGARSTRIRAALRDVDADVVVLTESHTEFCPGPDHRRAALSAPAPDRKDGECWVAIWVRHELRAEPLELEGQPERTAAIRVERGGGRGILIFGTVLPWRGDKRQPDLRGGRAFEHALVAQSTDWDRARSHFQTDELCVAGDLNQEVGAAGPVGTRRGRIALDNALQARELTCVTGGAQDPLLARGWRAGIDHVVLSRGLRCAVDTPVIWPEVFPLPRGLPDHFGICVEIVDR